MKDRESVTLNSSKPTSSYASYACIFDDLRKVALNHGWAVELCDTDIMVTPCTEDAGPFEDMIQDLSDVLITHLNNKEWF